LLSKLARLAAKLIDGNLRDALKMSLALFQSVSLSM
jgi:hypothetical protein